MLKSAATSPAAAPAQAAGSVGAAVAWFRRNVHAVIFLCVYAATLFALGAQEFVQDTWLTLSGGRDIAEHGLPWHERLTALNAGHTWIDQQWLGKLFLYGVAELGGVRLLLFVHVLFVAAAVAAAMAVARRRGATDAAVFWIGIAVMSVAPWAWQLRVQSLAYVLFVAVVAVLSIDRSRITRNTWLAVPLLVVWANVHGSVTVGVLLAVGAGLLRLRRQPVAGSLLVLASSAALVASPYGWHLLSYYRTLLLNPTLTHSIAEWSPSAYPAAVPFFVIAFGATWLVARNSSVLSAFEKLVLVATCAAGFTAIRGVVWFALAAVLLLPKVLDAERSRTTTSPQRILQPLALICGTVAMFVAAAALIRLPELLARAYPPDAAAAVTHAAALEPSTPVFASERYANWLLWRDPQLAGRLVYDVRFELFSPAQFRALALFHDRLGSNWTSIVSGARVVMLDRVADGKAEAGLRTRPGWRVLFGDAAAVVLAR